MTFRISLSAFFILCMGRMFALSNAPDNKNICLAINCTQVDFNILYKIPSSLFPEIIQHYSLDHILEDLDGINQYLSHVDTDCFKPARSIHLNKKTKANSLSATLHFGNVLEDSIEKDKNEQIYHYLQYIHALGDEKAWKNKTDFTPIQYQKLSELHRRLTQSLNVSSNTLLFNLSRIRILLDNESDQISAEDISFLSSLSSLTEFHYEEQATTDDTILPAPQFDHKEQTYQELLKALPSTLQSLSIPFALLSDESILQLKKFNQISHFDIHGSIIYSERKTLADILKNIPASIKYLDVSATNGEEQDFNLLKRFTFLEYLDLGYNDINLDSILDLLPTTLRYLDLSSSSYSAEKTISFRKLDNLSHLHLRNSFEMNPFCWEEIFKNLPPGIVKLDISDNIIPSVCLKSIKQHLPNLNEITIEYVQFL